MLGASIAFYLREHQRVKQFKVEPQTDGSLIITLKPAFEHEVIRWILGEAGKIEVLNPPELRAKVAAAGKLIWERNQNALAPVPEEKAKESSSRTKNVSTKKTTNSKAGKSGRP